MIQSIKSKDASPENHRAPTWVFKDVFKSYDSLYDLLLTELCQFALANLNIRVQPVCQEEE